MRFWETIQQYLHTLTGDPTSYSAVLTKTLMAIALAVLLWFLLKLLLAFLRKKSQKFDILHDNAIIFQSLGLAVKIVLLFVTGIYIFRMLNIPSRSMMLLVLLVV